ncbi:MAG: adenosylcobinamide-GDP ribazoletransferase [Pseudomonadota bacterium]
MNARVGNELAIFALAVQFLTRIPVPVGNAYTPARLAAAPRYFPLVGAMVGGLCAAVFLLAQPLLGSTVSTLLVLAAGMLLTGAFHEDGLADTFDGLGAVSREQMLTVMRDSRLGTFGAAALGLVIALKAGVLIELPLGTVATALAVGHGLSRLSAVLVIATSRYVRDEGTGKPTADGIDSGSLRVALLTGVVMLAWVAATIGFSNALSVLAGLLLGHAGMRALFERRLGGYTGDTLGAVQQTSELGVYLGLLLWL